MTTRGQQQFQRRNQQYTNQTLIADLKKQNLQKQIQYQKLFTQYRQIYKRLQISEQQKNNIKQTLKNLIPENTWLRNAFQQVKSTLSHIQEKQQEFVQQLNEKDRKIEELTAEIEKLNKSSEMRKSDLSNIGELVGVLEEKTKLEEQIQALKKERILSNEKYEQKLEKKDELLKKINQQNQQTEVYYKQMLTKKVRMIQSLQQQLKQTKRTIQQLKTQLKSFTDSYTSRQNQQISQLKDQIQSLINHIQQLKKQNQRYFQEKQQLVSQSRNSITNNVNISRQIQLKQQYIILLEQSRKQLANNQLELQKTFALLEAKQNQIRFKNQEIQQLKSNVNYFKQHQGYLDKCLGESQSDKSMLVRKLEEKDVVVRGLEEKMEGMKAESEKYRNRVRELEVALANNSPQLQAQQKAKKQSKSPTNLQKQRPNPSSQQFFDCYSQKQLFQQQLRQTKKSLTQEKNKMQQNLQLIQVLLKQNQQLKKSIQTYKSMVQQQNSQIRRLKQRQNNQNNNKYHNGRNGISQSLNNNSEHLQDEVRILKQQNKKLQQKIVERNNKIEQKNKKIEKIENQLRQQYEGRIKALEKEIYRMSENEIKQPRESSRSGGKDGNNNVAEELIIDDLGLDLGLNDQFEVEEVGQSQRILSNSPIKKLEKQRENGENIRVATNRSNNETQSKDSRQSEQYRIMRAKYEELRVENDSLKAHLQRLSQSFSQNKQLLQKSQRQNQNLQTLIKQIQQKHQNQSKRTKTHSNLQNQLKQLKQQLQTYQNLKQLLKIQKTQSKQKTQKILSLQKSLKQLQKSNKQLKQDYINLQQINQQTNQKYKKTLQTFKKQMNQMNQQILRQKTSIEDKKKQLKRVESEYMNKISHYQDENMNLRSKLKKQELQLIKFQQRLKELQEEQIEKVIITRTQFVNYKQTQKRLEDLEEQINSFMKDREKMVMEKKSLESYYEQQISLMKSNFGSERQKLLKKLTEIEESRSENELKLQKNKEFLEKKRKECMEYEGIVENLTKENYNIKLELSEALSETNMHLIKNKALSQKLVSIENQFEEIKMSYEGLMLEKSKYEKEKMSFSGMKVELEMAYKQIEKLNGALMERQRKLKTFLTQPSNDTYHVKENYQNSYYQNPNYSTDYNYPQKPFKQQRIPQRQYSFANQPSFGSINQNQAHYKSSKSEIFSNLNNKDYIQETNTYKLFDPSSIPKNYQKPQIYKKRNSPPKNHQSNRGNQRYIGGFPAQYCTFAPQYHKI